jgi:hypothetical protein
MYLSEQPPFLNAAVLGHTDLSPLQLLYHLKQIEKAAGKAAAAGIRSLSVGHMQQCMLYGNKGCVVALSRHVQQQDFSCHGC